VTLAPKLWDAVADRYRALAEAAALGASVTNAGTTAAVPSSNFS
jgi:hypothetical protein